MEITSRERVSLESLAEQLERQAIALRNVVNPSRLSVVEIDLAAFVSYSAALAIRDIIGK